MRKIIKVIEILKEMNTDVITLLIPEKNKNSQRLKYIYIFQNLNLGSIKTHLISFLFF